MATARPSKAITKTVTVMVTNVNEEPGKVELTVAAGAWMAFSCQAYRCCSRRWV